MYKLSLYLRMLCHVFLCQVKYIRLFVLLLILCSIVCFLSRIDHYNGYLHAAQNYSNLICVRNAIYLHC